MVVVKNLNETHENSERQLHELRYKICEQKEYLTKEIGITERTKLNFWNCKTQ